MGRDEDKLIRQLSLLSFLLSRPRPFTAREVQESVEGYADMSDDTFARRFHADRSDLGKVGIEIHVVNSPEAREPAENQLYYLSQEDFRLPAVEFTPAESTALCVALAALDGRFAYARPLRLALTSILRGSSATGTPELEQLPIALAPDEDAVRAGKRLSKLEQAVTRGKTVSFSYPSAEGMPLERMVDPYSLFLIQGHWYVVGRDHLRDAIRTFRVGRIVGAVRLSTEKVRDFIIPADYDPETYGARPPWLMGKPKGTTTVRVTSDLAWWVKRLQPHVTVLEEDEDDGATFLVPFADETLLLSWVAGLVGSGELLEPRDLRERIASILTGIAEAHSGEGQVGLEVRTRARRVAKPEVPESAPVAPEHLARAIALLSYLVDERRPSLVPWTALEQDLGMTRSEVETDLSLISLANFGGGTYALTAEAEPGGVRVWRDVMADSFSRPARLSPIVARALLLALDLLGDALVVAGPESLKSVRDKVHSLIATDSAESKVIFDELVPAAPGTVEVLNRAIRERTLVGLDYFTPARQELTERLVEPYLLFHSADGWYLEAFCLKAMSQRTFKLERIRAARGTDTVFSPRPEVDLSRRRTGQPFTPTDAAGWATVRFHPRWRTYLDEQGTQCSPSPDGWVIARMPYLDERWIAQEMLRYLGEAVLEQPASARDRVRDLAAVLAARYAGEHPPTTPTAGKT